MNAARHVCREIRARRTTMVRDECCVDAVQRISDVHNDDAAE